MILKRQKKKPKERVGIFHDSLTAGFSHDFSTVRFFVGLSSSAFGFFFLAPSLRNPAKKQTAPTAITALLSRYDYRLFQCCFAAPGFVKIDILVFSTISGVAEVYTGNMGIKNEIIASPSVSRRDQDSDQSKYEQLSQLGDGKEVGDVGIRTYEGDGGEPDSMRRNIDNRMLESISLHRRFTEPCIIVQTTSEVDILDDGYKWFKYGQRVLKGNPYARSYYKCRNLDCRVRKHAERVLADPKSVSFLYVGKHNHDIPGARD